MRTTLRATLLLVFLSVALSAGAQVSFQSVTLLFNETWTGNAYRQPYVNVTGSEGTPIDAHGGGGVRIALVQSLLYPGGTLTLDPRLTLGVRRYLLYPDGRVVPSQIEQATGATEDPNVAGIGSARVITIGLAIPIGFEAGIGSRAGISLAFSPTTVFRIRAGDVDGPEDASELNPMYSYFYGRLRWLRPELHLAFRADVSDYLSVVIRATSSVSIMDLAANISDPVLPWWDQFQAGGSVELALSPPFSGLFRETDTAPESTVNVRSD
jgi:hypothetical protein